MKQRPYTTFAVNLSDGVLYFCRHRMTNKCVDIGAGWIGGGWNEDDHGMEWNGIEYYVNR